MPVYRATIEVQFECDADAVAKQEDALANAAWSADDDTNADITAVRVHAAAEGMIDFHDNQAELPGVEIVDPANPCGCQEIMSPVSGVLFVGEVGTEVQRCDTHRPEPRFVDDDHAARYLDNWGVQVELRDRGGDDGPGWFITDLGDFEIGQSAVSFPAPDSTPGAPGNDERRYDELES